MGSEKKEPKPDPAKSLAGAVLGSKGSASLGGKARWASLTPTEKRELSQKMNDAKQAKRLK